MWNQKHCNNFYHLSLLFFPHRISLPMNGCQHTLETKSFLLIQVRITWSACGYKQRGTGNAPVPTNCGELSYRWLCLTNMCSVSKTSPRASFLLLNKHPQLKKVNDQMGPSPHSLFIFTAILLQVPHFDHLDGNYSIGCVRA